MEVKVCNRKRFFDFSVLDRQLGSGNRLRVTLVHVSVCVCVQCAVQASCISVYVYATRNNCINIPRGRRRRLRGQTASLP